MANGLHVGIIMDGNGRWAAARGLPRTAGHWKGVDAVRRTCAAAPSLGIRALTLFAFSSDNWKRPPGEVAGMMDILRRYLGHETGSFARAGVRVSVIGRRDRLPGDLVGMIDRVEATTRGGTSLHVRLAVDYCGREAILGAVARMACPGRPSAAEFTDLMDDGRSAGDVDLLVRTSGERRLSDFMPWEAAQAEILFLPVMWPDFDGGHLRDALADFRGRERRFGGLPATGAGDRATEAGGGSPAYP